MPAQEQYDAETIRKKLAVWAEKTLPDADDIQIGELTAPGETGFSSETMLVDVAWTSGGSRCEQRWVLRTRPKENAVFPDYDLRAQYRCMELVAAHSSVPVPKVRWYEDDATFLGEPFYVMDRVDGEVPSDSPPYTVMGFLAEASAGDQERLYRAEIAILAELHALDWKKLGFDFLDRKQFGPPGFQQQVRYYEDFFVWASEGRPQPTLEAAFDWIRSQEPPNGDAVVLNWGDARPSNIMVRDFQPVGVLDWEMATLGPPEVDLAWFIYLNRFLSEGIGAPSLPGFLGEAETAAFYEQISGHCPEGLHYYQVWAGLRFGVLFLRIIQRMERDGTLIPGWTEQNNMVTQFLAKVADLPAPT